MQTCGAAACDTPNAWPAMLAVPMRVVVAVFAATAKVTEPGPVRPAPSGNVRNPLLLVALHAHPVCVVTLTTPLDAVSATLALEGLIE